MSYTPPLVISGSLSTEKEKAANYLPHKYDVQQQTIIAAAQESYRPLPSAPSTIPACLHRERVREKEREGDKESE